MSEILSSYSSANVFPANAHAANRSRDYEKTTCMGLASDLDKMVEEQAFFDGCVCVRRYYSNHNWALKTLLGNVKHEKFV